MEPTGMFFGAHLFGWMLVLLLGIGIGGFMARRRFARMAFGGSGPCARTGGGRCGPRQRGPSADNVAASDGKPPATPPASPN